MRTHVTRIILFAAPLMAALPLGERQHSVAAEKPESNVVDWIVQRDVNSPELQASFCSREGLVGHAFLLLTSHDTEMKACKIEAAVGFWPDAEKDKKRLVAAFGPMKGKLLDELKKHGMAADAACRLTIRLTPDEDEILKIKIGAFAGRQYQLLGNDCVTFCEEVARDVLQLDVPDREKLFAEYRRDIADLVKERGLEPEGALINSFPARYVRELTRLNGKDRID
jgi:hypothetical protein